jgi:sarcosine oxidase subunit alpha
MGDRRVTHHPILSVPAAEPAPFTWAGTPLTGHVGETLAAALAANGVRVFGHHPRDGAPQGLFCASGQCAQCLVLADGEPVKACVARLRPGQRLSPRDSLPVLPPRSAPFRVRDTPHHATRVLIVGGGPAGLSAAIRLDQLGVDCLVVDDKPLLGGKLVLQTHRFFGSFNAVHAGTRGLDIAARLAREAEACPRVTLWRGSTALAVFEDGAVGVLRGADERPGEEGQYTLVTPERLLVASGARERFFAFPGNTLPGVMGAGAFQTLLHRDLVRPAERVLVVGGGNVGLIAAYQAIQAGIEVVAVVDVMPQCGGYKVHQDKLARLGVPLHTRTTLVSVEGREEVESATIATVDDSFRPLPGSHRTLRCDAVLLAVGLEPAAELFEKARELGLPAFRAGDAEEVAEASSAIFAGRIRAQELALSLGATEQPIPPEWHRALDILRSRPGAISPHGEEDEELHGLEPVIHCVQEIPCDPCAASCPAGGIRKDPDDIRHLPVFVRDALGKACVGCEKCVTICPGQAITLVDERKDPEHPFVWVPFELDRDELHEGAAVVVVDVDGHILGDARVVRIRGGAAADHTLSVKLRAERAIARRIAGIRLHEPAPEGSAEEWAPAAPGETIVCRCERVSADTLRALVRGGYRDPNELKVLTRAGLGACGAHTCGPLLYRLFREEGLSDAPPPPRLRPLLVEVSLGALAGALPEVDDER